MKDRLFTLAGYEELSADPLDQVKTLWSSGT
jgi:hypothetical protein